jgi:hypothetical protein
MLIQQTTGNYYIQLQQIVLFPCFTYIELVLLSSNVGGDLLVATALLLLATDENNNDA